MNEKQKDANIIHNLFAEFHCADDLGVIKSKLTEYVTTVRQETRAAAFKDAKRIAADFKRLDQDTLWQIYKTLSIETAIEAAANSVPDSEGKETPCG